MVDPCKSGRGPPYTGKTPNSEIISSTGPAVAHLCYCGALVPAAVPNNLDRRLHRAIVRAFSASGELAGEGFIWRLAQIATDAVLELLVKDALAADEQINKEE